MVTCVLARERVAQPVPAVRVLGALMNVPVNERTEQALTAVLNGLQLISESALWMLKHDAARIQAKSGVLGIVIDSCTRPCLSHDRR